MEVTYSRYKRDQVVKEAGNFLQQCCFLQWQFTLKALNMYIWDTGHIEGKHLTVQVLKQNETIKIEILNES